MPVLQDLESPWEVRLHSRMRYLLLCTLQIFAALCLQPFFRAEDLDVKSALDTFTSVTRFGPGGRRRDDYVHHPVLDEEHVWSNPFLRGLEDYAARHMCDQGDGNHFGYLGQIEVTEAMSAQLATAQKQLPAGHYYVLVTHHGSRGLGAQVYKRGVKAAERHTSEVGENIPKWGHWLDYSSEEGQDYWDALQYVARWTKANHQAASWQAISTLRG